MLCTAVWVVIQTGGARKSCRTGNESGELPIHVGSRTVKEVLEPWDIGVTEELIETWKRKQEQKLAKTAEEHAERLKVLHPYT